MKKIAISVGIAACTLLVANAQETKTVEKQAIKPTPVTKAIEPVKINPATRTNAPVAHDHDHGTAVSPEPVVQNPNAPQIVFETEVMDYGKVEYNGDGVRVFKFKNSGKEPLIITNAQGSCGCTVPTWPKEPIMPGKSGEISVKYATNRVGSFTKTVTISSNASTPSKRLTIKGEVGPQPVVPAEETVPVKKVIEGATPVENR